MTTPVRDIHDTVSVEILDTLMDDVRTVNDRSSLYWWLGDGSCDCNRSPTDEFINPELTCRGCHRYLIVVAEGSPLTLDELNNFYPVELRNKYLPKDRTR